MEKSKIIKIVNIFLVLFIILTLFSYVYDGDTYFHIKIGEKILKDGIFRIDSFSIHPELKYIAYAYLFDIITFIFYKTFGFIGITILKYIFLSIFTFITYKFLYYINKNKTFVYLLLLLISITLSSFFVIRPQVISFIFLILQIFIIQKWFDNKNSKVIFLLPFTFLILSNLHAGVIIFHLGVTCIFFFSFLIDEKYKFNNFFKNKYFYKYLIIILLCISFSLINPYFPDIIKYAVNTISDSYMMKISEWKSPICLSYIGISIIIISCIVIKTFKKENVPIQYIIFVITMIIFSIKSSRFFPYLLISFFIYVSSRYNNYRITIPIFKNKNIYKFVFCFFVIISLDCSYSKIKEKKNFIFEGINPIETVKYMKKNNIKTNIYNEYNYGGFILFNDIKVFVDQRCDLYSNSFNNSDILKDTINIDSNSYNPLPIFKKYNIEYAIINKNSNSYIIHMKDNLINYVPVFEEENFILLKIHY